MDLCLVSRRLEEWDSSFCHTVVVSHPPTAFPVPHWHDKRACPGGSSHMPGSAIKVPKNRSRFPNAPWSAALSSNGGVEVVPSLPLVASPQAPPTPLPSPLPLSTFSPRTPPTSSSISSPRTPPTSSSISSPRTPPTSSSISSPRTPPTSSSISSPRTPPTSSSISSPRTPPTSSISSPRTPSIPSLSLVRTPSSLSLPSLCSTPLLLSPRTPSLYSLCFPPTPSTTLSSSSSHMSSFSPAPLSTPSQSSPPPTLSTPPQILPACPPLPFTARAATPCRSSLSSSMPAAINASQEESSTANRRKRWCKRFKRILLSCVCSSASN